MAGIVHQSDFSGVYDIILEYECFATWHQCFGPISDGSSCIAQNEPYSPFSSFGISHYYLTNLEPCIVSLLVRFLDEYKAKEG